MEVRRARLPQRLMIGFIAAAIGLTLLGYTALFVEAGSQEGLWLIPTVLGYSAAAVVLFAALVSGNRTVRRSLEAVEYLRER